MIRPMLAATAALALSCASLWISAAALAQDAPSPQNAPPASESAAPQIQTPVAEPLEGAAKPDILTQARAAFGSMCTFDGPEGPGVTDYELIYKYDGDPADQAARKATLHEVFCMSGAYNVVTVYMITDEYDETSAIAFAEPAFRAVYEDDDYEKSVIRIDVTGFSAATRLVNASFDEATGVLTTFSKWRGIGDASSIGTYRFVEGEFVLTKFEVDASYDDEINHTVIYDATPETP